MDDAQPFGHPDPGSAALAAAGRGDTATLSQLLATFDLDALLITNPPDAACPYNNLLWFGNNPDLDPDPNPDPEPGP